MALADRALRPFVFYLLNSARTSHELEIPGVPRVKSPPARGIIPQEYLNHLRVVECSDFAPSFICAAPAVASAVLPGL